MKRKAKGMIRMYEENIACMFFLSGLAWALTFTDSAWFSILAVLCTVLMFGQVFGLREFKKRADDA